MERDIVGMEPFPQPVSPSRRLVNTLHCVYEYISTAGSLLIFFKLYSTFDMSVAALELIPDFYVLATDSRFNDVDDAPYQLLPE